MSSVFAELAQAAASIGELDRDPDSDPIPVGVAFARVALATTAAIPRINPNLTDRSPIRVKTELLELIDEEVEEWIAGSGLWDRAQPAYWLEAATALLFGAADGVTGLQGWHRDIEGDGGCATEAESNDPRQIAETISDSLLEAAVMATAAVQWFEQKSMEGLS